MNRASFANGKHVGRNIGRRWPCSSALPGTVRHHVLRTGSLSCSDPAVLRHVVHGKIRGFGIFSIPPPLFFAQAAGAQRRLPAASRLISFQSQAPSTAGTGPRKNAMARLG